MAVPKEEPKNIREELTWVDYSEPSWSSKAKSKGYSLYLVPIGCLVTVGILARGLVYMTKRDSQKQQMFMRYRVLAQGITLAIAIAGIFQVQK